MALMPTFFGYDIVNDWLRLGSNLEWVATIHDTIRYSRMPGLYADS